MVQREHNGFIQTASYIVGPSGEQLTEFDASGNWRHTNAYAGGKLIGTYDGSPAAPTLHLYVDDPLGTRRAQVNATTGTIEATYQSLPFGDGLNTRPGPGAIGSDDPTENHFTNKERDTETGNDYMFARYYNSATGRFLSPDWDAKSSDPVPYAKLGNPQSLNLYSYVYNNPLNREDDNGHDVHYKNDLLKADFMLLASRSKTFARELKAANDDHTINVVVQLAAFAGNIPHGAKADAVMHQNWDKKTGELTSTDIFLNVNIGNLKQEAHEMGHEHDMRTDPGTVIANDRLIQRDAGQPDSL